MVRTVPPILIMRMVDTHADLSFETSLLVIIILHLQYLCIYYFYLRVHCQDNVLVCHSFAAGVAEKKYPREAKTILAGSTVKYLAGTKMRAQPEAPRPTDYQPQASSVGKLHDLLRPYLRK